MKNFIPLIILLSGLISFTSDKDNIPVIWVDHLDGDFSFRKKQSIECEAWCYEWAGTKSIKSDIKNEDTVHCYTMMNAATHCSLDLILTNKTCLPTVVLKSIVLNRDMVYAYKSGYIKIDRLKWEKRILKAEFDFEFLNPENDKRIFWKGKIYCKIKNNRK